MQKIFLLFSLFTLLGISFVRSPQVFAACSLTINPSYVDYTFNGKVTFTSSSDCFQTSQSYFAFAYQQGDAGNTIYYTSDGGKTVPLSANHLQGTFDFTHFTNASTRPTDWIAAVCGPVTGDPTAYYLNCVQNQSFLGIVNITVTNGNTSSPSPISSPTSPVTPTSASTSIPTSSSPTSSVNNPCPYNKCDTAIGTIDVTNGTAFVTILFRIILSLSGGIALLLIIFSGYGLMISQGNPEKIKGAQETLTSAIIGFGFIILSVTILQVIGVDVLRLPGFNK